MDFIRAAIKAFFYDYPPELVHANITSRGVKVRLKDYMQPFVHLLKFREQMFSMTELKALSDVVQTQWMNRDKKIPQCAAYFLLLNEFTDKTLKCDARNVPIVHFDNLLRWRELTLLIGEELPTTAFLAKNDILNNVLRDDFTWSDTLSHDNDGLNRCLDKGINDVHAHLGATSDISNLNWISLMNNIGPYSMIPKDKDWCPIFQDNPIALWEYNSTLTLRQWGIVAAYIRELMMEILGLQKDILEGDDRLRCIENMITGKMKCVNEAKHIQSRIGKHSLVAKKINKYRTKVWDYAISSQINCPSSNSPYMLHYGERYLLYQFFRRLYEHDAGVYALAPYVYLYELIKLRYRKEMVQTNKLLGFENFGTYNSRKLAFTPNTSFYNNVKYRYALQTTTENLNDSIEARATIDSIESLGQINFSKSLLENNNAAIGLDQVTFVCHLLKSSIRAERLKYATEVKKIIARWKRNDRAYNKGIPKLQGIDAAGMEINCRPEAFGFVYRYARLCGLKHFTYHVGEDFYDILDGIRMIDEAIRFLQLKQGDRLGHAIALGISPVVYYARRRQNSVLPRMVLLDNLVWLDVRSKELGVTLSPETSAYIHAKTPEIYNDCKYGGTADFDFQVYWLSMALRSDDISRWDKETITKEDIASTFIHGINYNDVQLSKARELCRKYHDTGRAVAQAGKACVDLKVEKSLYEDIFAVQEAMLDMIEKKGICIECCPSSNLLITPVERYDELPILRFYPLEAYPRHRISVSINTDDRGIFATSLRNEYSLLACSMKKTNKWSDHQIIDYIERIRTMNKQQRFS